MKKCKLLQLFSIVAAITLGILMIWQPLSAYAYSGTFPSGNGLFVLYYGYVNIPASEDSTLKTIMSKQPNFVIFGNGLQDRGDIPDYVHKNNGRAIQYIPLNYGNEASDVVDTKITTAMKAGYDGIFFDETDATKAEWNAERAQKVRQFGATKLVFVNPGIASPPSSIFDYADIVSVENKYDQMLPSYSGIQPWRWLAVQGDPANQAASSAEEAFNRRTIFQKNGGFWYYSSNQQATGATHINLPPWYEKFADLVKDTPSTQESSIWRPKPGTTWYWQLQGNVDQSIDALVYDIDLFDNTQQLVEELHKKGRKVICYVNVGAYEDWREDGYKFTTDGKKPKSDNSNLDQNIVGKSYGEWPGEYWLNIKEKKVRDIMKARLQLCKSKGFDGVEPDNIDSYFPVKKTGFDITKQDQIDYDKWLVQTAHSLDLNLSIGMKNDPENARNLVDVFDWALTEDCFAQNWCEQMKPFIDKGKAVFSAEYTDEMESDKFTKNVCNQAQKIGFIAILLNRDLNGKPVAKCF